MPQAVPLLITAIGAAVSGGAGVLAGSAVIGSLVGAVVTTGLGLAYNSLTGNKKNSALKSLADRNHAIKDNITSNVADIPVVYGTARMGGSVIYANTAGRRNKFLYMILCVSEGEVEAIPEIYLDNVLTTDPKFSGLVTSQIVLGSDNQDVPAFMLEAPEWTANDKLRGLTYIALKLSAESQVFPRIPTITCTVKGRKVFDPRDSLTKFSNNPALCIRDYLINSRFGRGLATSFIDTQSFIDAANYCDQLVTLQDGTQQVRYTLDGAILTGQPILDNLKDMLTSCRGWLVLSAGKYKLLIDKPETTSFAFNEDNIIGAWSIQFLGKRNRKNKIEAQYFEPAKSSEPDIVLIQNESFKAEDHGVELSESIELPFTTNRNRAQQLALMTLKQSRMATVVQFKATIAALQAEVGEVISITHSTPGWVNKLMRIVEIRLESDDEVSITAIAYDENVYTLDNINDLNQYSTTTLEDPVSIQPTGIPSVTRDTYLDTNGNKLIKAVLLWSPSISPFVKDYIVEYKLTSSSDWIFAGKTQETTFSINAIQANIYDFRVKATNTLGFSSSYSSVFNREIDNIVIPPGDISGLKGDINGGVIKLRWDESVDPEVKSAGYIVIRHSSNGASAAWSDPANIEVHISGNRIDVTLPILQGTYLLKAENLAGVQSVNPALFTTNLAEKESSKLVTTYQEDANFSGPKTNMTSSNGLLYLDGVGLFDSEAGSFDSAIGIFDEIGGFVTNGSYQFASVTDLGRVYFVRIKKSFDGSFSDLTNNFEGRAGNFDEQTGLFDGANPTNIRVRHFYRATHDNPLSSPVWGDWYEFNDTEAKGRSFQFKIEVTSEHTEQNLYINHLTSSILMNDRSTSQSDLAVSHTGTAVAYTKAFYQKPRLSITIKNPQSGDYAQISAESATGFTLNIYDKTNVAVDRVVDWIATGLGEETV